MYVEIVKLFCVRICIIGSNEFVAEDYQRFKHLFYSEHEKKPNRSKGYHSIHAVTLITITGNVLEFIPGRCQKHSTN